MGFLKDLADKTVLHAELSQERQENGRLRRRVHNLRRAIKDQQKSTMMWKGLALGKGVKAKRTKDGSSVRLVTADDQKPEATNIPSTGTEG